MIELHDVTKSFEDRQVLKNINLTIQPGEVVVLKGENGSGKTTLLNIILGILKPDRGEVKLCGVSPQDPSSKTRVGVMLQSVGVPKNLKVRELISLMQSYYPHSLSTEEILGKVGLQKKQDLWCSKLCGGERKRLDLGIALTGNPQLLILDEPTAGLDEEGRKQFWETFRRCVAKGVAVLIVTHLSSDWQELETLATRWIKLQDGQLIEQKAVEYVVDNDPVVFAPKRDQASAPSSQCWSTMFTAQIQTELLQLIRNPMSLIGLLLFCVVTSLISSSNYGVLGLALCGGLAVLTFAIDRVGKQIALERVEGWLKLLRVTPLQPTAYLAAKLAVSMLILAGILMLVLPLSASRTHGATLGNEFSLFFSLLIGVVPFAIAGSALGYLVKPKSLDQIAGLSIPVALFTCGLMPTIPKDIVVLSPFYHYGQFALWSIGSPHFDHHFFFHLLWLLTTGYAFFILALWAYQRDEVLH